MLQLLLLSLLLLGLTKATAKVMSVLDLDLMYSATKLAGSGSLSGDQQACSGTLFLKSVEEAA